MKHLFAQVLKPVRHAGSESELDVLGKRIGNLAFALYVVSYVLASERYRRIVAHNVSVIYGQRCAAASEIYQGDSVFHLCRSQDSLGGCLCREVFPFRGYSGLRERLVNVLKFLFLADENLEMPLKSVAGHSDYVILDYLEKILPVGE